MALFRANASSVATVNKSNPRLTEDGCARCAFVLAVRRGLNLGLGVLCSWRGRSAKMSLTHDDLSVLNQPPENQLITALAEPHNVILNAQVKEYTAI